MESDLGKLFIGGISWDTNEDRLREYFKSYGEVVEAVIMKDRTTGRARGFGFIVFADPVVAERVVMEKHIIDGRMVEAKKAVPRDDQNILNRNGGSTHGSPAPDRTKKIFVGGLPSTITEIDFKKYFDQFGTIIDVVVMYDHNTQRPRGFGFITYDSEDAVDKVLLKTFHELNGKMVEVKRAIPKELSPGPNIRSPVGGYSYGLNSRVNGFLNEYTQGCNLSLIGNYGMKLDSRLGSLANGRNGYPSFGPGLGTGMNFESGLSSPFGGNSDTNDNLGYGQDLNPYYSGSSSRFSNPIGGYRGGTSNSGLGFNPLTHNVWGSSRLNFNTTSENNNAYTTSGSESIGSFGNNSLDWGVSYSPISGQGARSGAGYGGVSPGYGRENGSSFGRNNGFDSTNVSLSSSRGGYEGAYERLYRGSSVYGDPTWRLAPSELDATGPFGYGLDIATSDIMAKGSAGYMGG
ncbi:uncharacterized protein [Typha latifolia]|uniref:uncharacterized protein n=1 Tax=Typha latifolia TaxID=4733 RepID=UPI003C2B560C